VAKARKETRHEKRKQHKQIDLFVRHLLDGCRIVIFHGGSPHSKKWGAPFEHAHFLWYLQWFTLGSGFRSAHERDDVLIPPSGNLGADSSILSGIGNTDGVAYSLAWKVES
jgi:hypothetical protein